MIFHNYRSFNILFTARVAYMGKGGAKPGKPTSAPAGGPSAQTKPVDMTPSTRNNIETPAMLELQKSLTALKNELDKGEKAATLMRLVERDSIDTKSWHEDPRNALPFFKKYHSDLFSAGQLDELKKALVAEITSNQYIAARETVLNIADDIGQRQAELEKARGSRSQLKENLVNGKIGNFVEDTWKNFGRMSTPEKLASAVAIFLFGRMALKDDPSNTFLRPLIMGGGAFLGANLLTQNLTGTSILDFAGNKLGLERFVPMTKDQLPAFTQGLAQVAHIEKPSELVAIGKLGNRPVKEIMKAYKPNLTRIDPYLFHLTEDQISGEHLFAVIDTLVKKHEVQRDINGNEISRIHGSFEQIFGEQENLTFLEASYYLFEKEAMATLINTMTTEEREKYLKAVREETDDMFVKDRNQDLAIASIQANPRVTEEGVMFYGVTFITQRKVDSEKNHQYIYHNGNFGRVVVRMKDSPVSKVESLSRLQDAARRVLNDATSHLKKIPGLEKAELVYGDKAWHLRDAKLDNGSSVDLKIEEVGPNKFSASRISKKGSVDVPKQTPLEPFDKSILKA